MRGASAESLAALVEEMSPSQGLLPRVARWAAAKLTDGSDAGPEASGETRLADDLFGVAEVLRREPRLRRTLTDGSLPAEAKAGLARQVFGEALHGDSLDLVSTAVGRRWTAPRDLADALEHLGTVAVVKDAEHQDEADRLEDELFGFGQLVSDNPELREALSDPARSSEDKQALLDQLLEGRATAGTRRLARQAVTGSHRTVALAIEEYQRVAAAHRRRLVATARVARDLGDGEAERLQAALGQLYDRPVHLNVVVDPDVMGGVRVEIGDEVIDGTVASRLTEAGRLLAG
jgi:F-type H+-transporting ATPase subunit delta